MDNLPIPIDEEEPTLPLPTAETSFLEFYEAHQLQKKPRRKGLRREKVAQAYDDVFELIGGVPRMALFAHEDPKEFYKQYARLIPTEQRNQFDGTIRVIGFVQPTALDGAIEGESE
jgi:hypothetical protein